jgi:hypothetical protein
MQLANFVAEAVIQDIRLVSAKKLICGPFLASVSASATAFLYLTNQSTY